MIPNSAILDLLTRKEPQREQVISHESIKPLTFYNNSEEKHWGTSAMKNQEEILINWGRKIVRKTIDKNMFAKPWNPKTP